MLGIRKDHMRGVIYAYTSRAIFIYSVLQESRYVLVDLIFPPA